ncbi:Outer membrane efflux protein [Roseovarius sp. THAF9]|uniref:TolC family protein n=1 Tax=Roseovarius sp. THAF9 TaxID=2587847 RepID=UPI00126868ED|nr:TolC family protein [Roseovarius sp. THAF9]QFT92450.1 Outer membrane efflux protein [Roseovarius sp. THAF9]
MGQRVRHIKWAWLALAGLSLPGCMSAVPSDEIEGESVQVSRLAGVTPPPGAIAAAREEAETSVIITELLGRESVLPAGSAFARVSDAVLKADARASASELKAARLRAQAASKNWLPRVGPVVSLASLSDVVTQLAVDMVLFDHGRKKAERDFAKADVELAAVTLSEDTNARVLTALSLYLDGAEARERAALERRTLKDMERFEYIMQERVRGGVSDRSDLGVLRQKLAEIRARLAAAEEAGATARAELNAMSAVPLDDVTGLADVRVGSFDARPLDILRAEAERDRDIAQARVDRAGLLPGINAGGTLGSGGTGVTVNAGQDSLLGIGTGASLKAIKAVEEASGRRVAQASEEATRQISRLESRLKALGRQVGEASQLTQEAKRNLDLFQGQYDAGQRQVMDVVGVYETFAEQQSRQVGLKYDLALTRLQLARAMGLLANGGRI